MNVTIGTCGDCSIIGMWAGVVIDGKYFGPEVCITQFKDGEWRDAENYYELLGEPNLWAKIPQFPEHSDESIVAP